MAETIVREGKHYCVACERIVGKGMLEHHRCKHAYLPPEPPGFPGATKQYGGVAHWSEAPPRCPRCNGLWRHVETGLRCVMCGRSCTVADALKRALRMAL